MDKKEQERIRAEDYELSRRSFNPVLILVVGMLVVVMLALVWNVAAEEVANLLGADPVLRVPGDYATIQAAIDAASAGEIIQVEAGVYVENLVLDKPVTLVAASFDEINPANNTSIIDGGGGAVAVLIPSGLAQMPVLRGFVIRNGGEGIRASSPFILESSLLHSASTLVVYQQGAGGSNRNNIYFRATNAAIRLDHSDRPLLIENNRILYNGEAGIEVNLQQGSAPSAMVEINIWNNMILGNSAAGIQIAGQPGEPGNTNRRFVIAGNLVANNTEAGLALAPGMNAPDDNPGTGTAEAVRAFNNTFYGNEYGLFGGENLVAFNNIIASSMAGGAWGVQGPAGSQAVVAYTLFYDNPVDVQESTLGEGVLTGIDPLFEAAPNSGPDGVWSTLDDDFSGLVLRSGSPAIDKGVSQYQASDGELIPPSPLTGFSGPAPDLGWREVGAPINVTPTVTPFSIFTSQPTLTTTPPATPATQASLPGSSPTLAVSPTSETPTPAFTTTASFSSPALTAPSVSPAASTATPILDLTIETLNPASAPANATVTMTITGAGFQPGAIVDFEGGQGLPQLVLGVQVVDHATILVTLNTQSDSMAGPQAWDVRVTNPDGVMAVLEDAFTVLAAP